MLFARSNAGNGGTNYGFSGSKAIHTLGFVGILLIAGAAYFLFDASLGIPGLILVATVAIHLGAWMLFGAGIVYWVSNFGRYILRDRQLARIPWRGDENVLDVGCGAGILLIAAAKRLSTGRAVGIDVWTNEHGPTDPAATVRANAKAERVGGRVDVLDADARDMEFADASFDVALSSFVFHHIDREGRKAAAREIVRVLKPGGRLVLLDIRFTEDVADAFREAGAVEVERTSVLPLVPGLRLVTARKPA